MKEFLQFPNEREKLMYRFIKIHPFPDSNGRTSRALLNALTLNRDILVSFTKEQKEEFLKISSAIHDKMPDDYLESLHQNSKKAEQMEEKIIEPLVNFVLKHSSIFKQDGNNESNIIQTKQQNVITQE